jgi:predicted nuclease with RNAse H fold
MQHRFWVGVDPGGANAFGIAIVMEDGEVTTACVSCADEAVDKIAVRPLGAGVDAPLWWSSGRSAEREADRWLRKTYGIPPGTVQTPNSLRGAALVQAAMFVQRLREKFPEVPVTETHPKALAFAFGGWESKRVAALGYRADLGEHERDAHLSSVCAREGFSGRWVGDLSRLRSADEQDPSTYWLAPVHYFWPEEIGTEALGRNASLGAVTSTKVRVATPVSHEAPLAAPRLIEAESVAEVCDAVLWIKRISGNPALQRELLSMTAGSSVLLRVDGAVGEWVKMRDGKSGASTPGLRPIGQAKDRWRILFDKLRGAKVEIKKEN